MGQDKNWRFCVAGNIVPTHVGDDGVTYYGTKVFSGGTKVYIDGKNWDNFERTNVVVLGKNRFGRWEFDGVDPELIENVRFGTVHSPTVLSLLKGEEATEGWFWYGRTAEDKRHAKAFAENWEELCRIVKERKESGEELW